MTSCTNYDSEKSSFVEPEEFRQAHWGIRVEDRETGELLLDHFGQKQFIPASVRKLFSTLTAFQALGPDYQFSTSVYAYSPIDEQGVIKGDLFIEGGLDPTFDKKGIDDLVMQLIEQGLNTIEGSVFSDLSKYKGPSRMKDAEWQDLTWGYCPEISALTYNKNQVTLKISPAAEDSFPATAEIEQDVPYMSFLSGVGTELKGEELSLFCHRGICDNTLEVRGGIPMGQTSVDVSIALHEPSEYALKVFENSLLERGVKIKKKSFRNQSTCWDLAEVNSPPLIDILELINKESQNLAAELVYLQIPENIRPELTDATGLSRHNLATPKEVCALIREGKDEWIDTLPIAGVDGTLKNRFVGTIAESNLRAKTGSMSGVLGLAGVAQTLSGRNVCFCIFINQFSQELSEAVKQLDQVVLDLLEKY